MVKLKDLISSPSRKDLEKAAAEPKKPKKPKKQKKQKKPRLHQCRWIASSRPEIEEKCKKIRYHEHKERENLKTIPVLFMCGNPDRRLSKEDADWYKSMGARVEYLSETEVKSLNIK